MKEILPATRKSQIIESELFANIHHFQTRLSPLFETRRTTSCVAYTKMRMIERPAEMTGANLEDESTYNLYEK